MAAARNYSRRQAPCPPEVRQCASGRRNVPVIGLPKLGSGASVLLGMVEQPSAKSIIGTEPVLAFAVDPVNQFTCGLILLRVSVDDDAIEPDGFGQFGLGLREPVGRCLPPTQRLGRGCGVPGWVRSGAATNTSSGAWRR